MHTVTGTLPARPPFDFAKSLRFLAEFTPTAGEQAITATSITKAVSAGGRAIAFQVTAAGRAEQPAVAYALSSEQSITSAHIAALEDRIAFFLSLDDDLLSFYATGRQDPPFAPIVERLFGLHQVKFLTPFEIACWAILTQRTPTPIARCYKQALVERYGTRITLDGVTHWAFPESVTLANVDPAELAALLHNERKAEYLSAVIAFFNEVDEQYLRNGPYDEVAERIRAVRGIGAWSARFILVRGIGRMERVDADDRELLRAAARVYGNGTQLATADLRRVIDRYGDAQGYWAYYLRNATLPMCGPSPAAQI